MPATEHTQAGDVEEHPTKPPCGHVGVGARAERFENWEALEEQVTGELVMNESFRLHRFAGQTRLRNWDADAGVPLSASLPLPTMEVRGEA